MTGNELAIIAEVFSRENYHFNIHAIPNAVAALIALLVGFEGMKRSHGNRVGQLFFLLGATTALWLGSRAIIYSSTSIMVAERWSAIYLVAMPLASGCILHLAADFVGRTRQLLPLIWLNWLVTCVQITLQLRLNIMLEGVAELSYGYIAITSLSGDLANAWLGFISVFSAAISYRAMRSAPKNSLLRQRLGLLTNALVLITLAGVDGFATESSKLYQPGWIFVLTSLAILSYMLFKHGLVDTKPAFAASRILNRLDSATLVIECSGRIRLANQATARLANAPLKALPGMSISQVLPDLLPVELLEQLRFHNRKYQQEISYKTVSGNARIFQMLIAPLKRERDTYSGDNPGFVVSLNDVSQLKMAEADLRYLSLHDSLTGLANRRQFMEKLNSCFALFTRNPGKKFTLIFLDLDKFKPVNDQYGHQAGDGLLCAVAEKLRRYTRSHDLCVRLGGDEFAIIAEDTVDQSEVDQLIQRLQHAISEPVKLTGTTVQISASIGYVQPQAGIHNNAEQLLHDADQSMYQAKHAVNTLAKAS